MTYHQLLDEVAEQSAEIEDLKLELSFAREEMNDLAQEVGNQDKEITKLTQENISLHMANDAQAKIIAKLMKEREVTA